MLTIAECREYLEPETSAEMTDDEVARVRDDLYTLARLAIAKHENESKLICQNQS